MNETAEVIKDVAGEAIKRLDALAEKLGLASEKVWSFTVRANIVSARRDRAKAVVLGIFAVAFLGWALHVATMKIPREERREGYYPSGMCVAIPSQHNGYIENIQPYEEVPCRPGEMVQEREIEGYVTEEGGWYIVSGLIFLALGLVCLGIAASDFINAIAAEKQAESNAFTEIIETLRG